MHAQKTQASESILQALDTAAYNEDIAMKFYKNLAAFCRLNYRDDLADFFIDQSNREKGHFNSLMKFKRDNYGLENFDKSKVIVKWLTPETGIGSGGLSFDESIEEVMKKVEWAEHETELFYRRQAEKYPDISEMFCQLAEDEANQHHLALEAMERLSKSKKEKKDS